MLVLPLTARRVILWFLSVLGAIIGAWALFLPRSFYSTFPDGLADGGLAPWVATDGPFNEHLIRDVGALYLALAAGGIVAALSTSGTATRLVAVAWIVFSAPHLLYHSLHLGGLAPLDAIAQPIALALTLVLPIPLLFTGRDPHPVNTEQKEVNR